MRQIMRGSLDYAGFAQLCGRSPIMPEIMLAHNRIIPRSLIYIVVYMFHFYLSQCLSIIADSHLLTV